MFKTPNKIWIFCGRKSCRNSRKKCFAYFFNLNEPFSVDELQCFHFSSLQLEEKWKFLKWRIQPQNDSAKTSKINAKSCIELHFSCICLKQYVFSEYRNEVSKIQTFYMKKNAAWPSDCVYYHNSFLPACLWVFFFQD